MAGLTLDAGALIAAERGDRRFFAFLKEAIHRGADLTVPSPVLAKAWRGNQPRLAKVLKGCVTEPLEERGARMVGQLLGKARTSDVVDATVVLGAAARGDALLTSDRGDLAHLAQRLGAELTLIGI